MRIFKRFCWLIVLLPLWTSAQTFETGGIVGLEYDMKILKGWHWNAETNVRFDNNFTQYDRWKIGIGTDYTFWKKRVKIGAAYSFMHYYDPENCYDFRHRITGSLTIGEKFGDVKISYRAAFQATFRNERRGDYTFNPKTYMRNRLLITYSIPQKPIRIYASEECWLRLYHPEKHIVDELRTTLGVKYNINKHHALDFYIRSTNEIQVSNPKNALYLGITYSID